MDELKSKLEKKVLHPSNFEPLWSRHQDAKIGPWLIAGDVEYDSYYFLGGYQGHKTAIIKGLWEDITEEEVIHEGFYLEDTDKLLAFGINPIESRRPDLPNYFFIIKDDEYVLRADISDKTTRQVTMFIVEAKRKLVLRYRPKPSL